MVESVDSAKLASTLNSSWEKLDRCEPLRVMIQINTSNEKSKRDHFKSVFLSVLCLDVKVRWKGQHWPYSGHLSLYFVFFLHLEMQSTKLLEISTKKDFISRKNS